ncbi:MAG: hypothetical protein LBJ10_02205 [Clostridiales bacterium]|jgi:hypothetical protein|nr:hypothetical protein [Clostridiales bacterium]
MAEADTERASFACKFIQFLSIAIPNIVGGLLGAVLLPLFFANDKKFIAMKTILIVITSFIMGLVLPQLKKLNRNKDNPSLKACK